MTTKLVITDGAAQLWLTADSDFERRTIEQLRDSFPGREIELVIEHHDYQPAVVKAAHISIHFTPKPLTQ